MKLPASTRTTRLDSPLGPLLLAATDTGLAGLWFEDQKYLPPWAEWPRDDHDPVLRQAAAELDAYFDGRQRAFSLPLDLSHGTAFQRSVWQALRHIPYGVCTTYGTLAAALGNPTAVRAVGTAVGRNPLGIIVPCHRVLGADGTLTGYAGGLGRKAALLSLESSVPTADDLFA